MLSLVEINICVFCMYLIYKESITKKVVEMSYPLDQIFIFLCYFSSIIYNLGDQQIFYNYDLTKI